MALLKFMCYDVGNEVCYINGQLTVLDWRRGVCHPKYKVGEVSVMLKIKGGMSDILANFKGGLYNFPYILT